MDKFKKPIKKSDDPEHPYGPEQVASSMEYTGLIPSLPMSDEEADAYLDLGSLPKQQKDECDPGEDKSKQSHPR